VNPAQKVFRDAHLAHANRVERIQTGEHPLTVSRSADIRDEDAEKQQVSHIEHGRQ
jgi:hypothetical protein